MASARISAPAGLDLEEIFVYIEQEAGEERAAGVIERILGAAEMLARSPRAGRRCSALLPGTRLFPAGRYLVYYREADGGVLISRVIHGSRDQKKALGLDEG